MNTEQFNEELNNGEFYRSFNHHTVPLYYRDCKKRVYYYLNGVKNKATKKAKNPLYNTNNITGKINMGDYRRVYSFNDLTTYL